MPATQTGHTRAQIASPPLSRPQLSDDAAAYLRRMIVSGQLRPGEVIQPTALGELLGISATPVREALQALRVEGFVELLPRRGFQVAPLTPQDIRDLFVALALLAGENAARAATNLSPGDLAELEALHHEILAAARRRDAALLNEKNNAFHGEIDRIADARKISWVMRVVGRYGASELFEAIEGWPESAAIDHGPIVAALAARDAEEARAAMYRHVVHAGDLLAESFDRRTADAQT